MPTYDFQCDRCGRVFEARLGMAEYAEGQRPACPGCGQAGPRRLFTSDVAVRGARLKIPITDEGSGGCGSGGGGCGCAHG
jgi:putative FmdB family regulatory protein